MKNIPTLEQAKKVLEIVDAGLVNGLGNAVPGEMCIEAAVCFALGEPHGDNPSCVSPAVRDFKMRLNDSPWPSPAARAKGMRKLAIAQLGSRNNIDETAFCAVLSKLTIQRVLPPILRKIGLEKEASACEQDGNPVAARLAARAAHAAAANTFSFAAYTVALDAAHAADHADAHYAASAARAADDDEILLISANCCLDALREVNAPGIALLDQLGI